jgi:NitT/TauT family transport system substrate-binding protein
MMKLRSGHLSTFYHTAIVLMSRTDLAGRLGAEPAWTLFGTGPAIMQAFGRGELDLAYVGLPPAIIGMENGVDVRCVAGGHMEGTVLAGKSPWRGVPDLAGPAEVLAQFTGAVIGVPGIGSIHDVILRDAIASAGLEGSVGVRNFPWADLVTEALAKGEVDAAMGTPALAVAARRFAGAKVLIPPALLWPNNPSYGIVVTRAFLERSREIVRRFLALHEEASTLLRERPAEAAAVISRQVGIVEADFVLETLAVSPKYCAQLTRDYIDCTMRFVRTLKLRGYIRRELREEEIFDRRLIDEVHPEQDHYEAARKKP